MPRIILLAAFLMLTRSVLAAPQAVERAEAQRWIRHTLPLPKQITLREQVTVPPTRLAIIAEAEGDSRIEQALRELRQGARVDAESLPSPEAAAFRIRLQLGGPDAEPLRALHNNDEAYRIVPGAARDELRLVALKPAGLLYAARTLAQLLAPRATDGSVTIPLVEVSDWPDMSRRGVWGSDSFVHTRWLGEMKMNHQEQIASIGVDKHGRSWARLKSGREPMVEQGPHLNVHPIPAVLHLEQVGGKGLFDAYPQLRATGGGEGAICYSQPVIVDVLADWIAALASLPGVSAVDVWMSENLHGRGGCRCEQCRPHDRTVLEAKAIVAAWHRAQERVGPVGLYVLTSEETEASNPQMLAALPEGVRVWYYHSLRTYTANAMPMLPGYVTEAAQQPGRWIGVCPSLVGMVGINQPFTGAQFVHARLNEFARKGMSGLLGYVTPRLHYNAFNLEAAAEWSWNATGRSPEEFATAFAVRHGITDPELFAEWSETIGPVAWDLHGSHWPGGERRNTPGPVAKLLRRGALPELGKVLWGVYPAPWGQIRSPDHLRRNVEQAQRAVELARRLDEAGLIAESEMVQGYVQALGALWELKQIARPTGIAEADRPAAHRWFAAYAAGLRQASAALPVWEATVRRKGEQAVTENTVTMLHGMIEQMQAVATDFGVAPGEAPR